MPNQDSTQEALEEFLKAITLSALARNAKDSEDITELLEATGLAVATRKIVDCVQFEEVWEEEVDDELEDSDILFMFITFRLAPRVCEAAIDQGHALNEMTWTLIVPDPESLEAEEQPKSSTELLMLAEVDVAIEAADELEILKSIIVLEEPRLN